MIDEVQEALTYADTFKKPDGLSLHECLIILAAAYREKCEEIMLIRKAVRDYMDDPYSPMKADRLSKAVWKND